MADPRRDREPERSEDPRPIFVVQRHLGRSPHYDFRLERDGVLKSWAVPKRPPTGVGTSRLALAVADHPLDFADFQGTIPQGQPGAGTIEIWDRGDYKVLEWTPDKVVVSVRGNRLLGSFALTRFPRHSERSWLLKRVS